MHIVSHADNRGTSEYNQKLSERRANAIKDYLIAKNVPSERLFIQAKGESQPKVDCGDNCTDEQLEANRRSVFFMMKLEDWITNLYKFKKSLLRRLFYSFINTSSI